MEPENIIRKELKELAPAVADINTDNMYSVPPGYFDNLAFDILKKIRADFLPVSANPYSVPAGYFENFAINVLNKVHEEKTEIEIEMEEVAPLLAKIGNKNIYTIDEDYFNTTFDKWKQPVKTVPVIPINSFRNRVLRLSAAASVLVVVTTASILYVNSNNQIANNNTSTEVRKQLANLSTEDISNYLQKDESRQILTSPAVEDEPDIENMLKKATDDEIEKYLESNDETDDDLIRDI